MLRSLGERFYIALLDHVKTQVVSDIGGIALSLDIRYVPSLLSRATNLLTDLTDCRHSPFVSEYALCMRALDDATIDEKFATLRELTQLTYVQPTTLRSLVDDGRLVRGQLLLLLMCFIVGTNLFGSGCVHTR